MIAVYGGSFNPIHQGHIDIIKYLDSTPWIDKVLVVVSPKNPRKQESTYIQSPTERLEAVRKELEGMKKCEASDIEFSRKQPIFTVDTLREIQTLYPDSEIRFVCGADCLEDMVWWERKEEILMDFGLIVFPRVGYDLNLTIPKLLEEYPGAKILVATYIPTEISSSKIRNDYDGEIK